MDPDGKPKPGPTEVPLSVNSPGNGRHGICEAKRVTRPDIMISSPVFLQLQGKTELRPPLRSVGFYLAVLDLNTCGTGDLKVGSLLLV